MKCTDHTMKWCSTGFINLLTFKLLHYLMMACNIDKSLSLKHKAPPTMTKLISWSVQFVDDCHLEMYFFHICHFVRLLCLSSCALQFHWIHLKMVIKHVKRNLSFIARARHIKFTLQNIVLQVKCSDLTSVPHKRWEEVFKIGFTSWCLKSSLYSVDSLPGWCCLWDSSFTITNIFCYKETHRHFRKYNKSKNILF